MRIWFLSLLIVLLFTFPSYSKVNCFSPSCHDRSRIIKGRAHIPVASEECLRCHLPHVSRYQALLKERPEELCFICHKEIKRAIAKAPFVHAPVAKRSCLRCHDPHSSPYKGLLKKTQKEICLSCHREVSKNFRYSRQPFKLGD